MVCKTALPDGISKDLSIIILIVNIFLPGIGTIVAGTMGDEPAKDTILTGVAQLVTSVIGIGWIWAAVWSIFLVKKADDSTPPLAASAPVPVAGDYGSAEP